MPLPKLNKNKKGSFLPKNLPSVSTKPKQEEKVDTPFAFEDIKPSLACRVGIYGPGGIGKTSLAAMAPGPIAFFDFDQTLGESSKSKNVDFNNCKKMKVSTYKETKDVLKAEEKHWKPFKSIIIDSLTRLEDHIRQYVLDTIPNDKGERVKNIEEYGWGKGFRHIYDEYGVLFSLLDYHVAQGRNIILVAHDEMSTVPNPRGDDWQRFEPRIFATKNNNCRARLKEWVDHLVFLTWDIAVGKDGKAAQGMDVADRWIYPTELPICMAKSRTLSQPILYQLDNNPGAFWSFIEAGDEIPF